VNIPEGLKPWGAFFREGAVDSLEEARVNFIRDEFILYEVG
jgi:hypothetical protein